MQTVQYLQVSLIEASFLDQMIIGNLLGDAWIERKSPTANARLGYEQSSKHSPLFFYVFKFICFLCTAQGYTHRTRTDPRTGTTSDSHVFKTRALPYLTRFYDLFYVNGVKTIPANIVEYLTPIAVAFWIMDDGQWNRGLVLNTQGFSTAEVQLLVDALNKNFGVNSYIPVEKGLPTIYVRKAEVPIIAKAVLPYMHPSMYYKLGVSIRPNPISTSFLIFWLNLWLSSHYPITGVTSYMALSVNSLSHCTVCWDGLLSYYATNYVAPKGRLVKMHNQELNQQVTNHRCIIHLV